MPELKEKDALELAKAVKRSHLSTMEAVQVAENFISVSAQLERARKAIESFRPAKSGTTSSTMLDKLVDRALADVGPSGQEKT